MVTKIARRPDNGFVQHLRESWKRDIEGWTCFCDVPGHGEFSALVFDGKFDRVECPFCKEDHLKEIDRKKRQLEFYDGLIKVNGVPADNVTATFETFKVREDEGDQVKFEDNLALKSVMALYESIGSRDAYAAVRNVTLCGKTGIGKSFLGAALASATKKAGKTVLFIQDSALLSQVLACGKGKGAEADQLRRRMEDYDILIVDDADHERWHNAHCAFFADLLIARNGALKGTLILTNRTYQDFVPAFGSAVESRLRHGKVISWIHGEDRRKPQKKEATA